MKRTPLVSIIIPVYNGSDYLRKAIESALNQTYKNIEILVINDGSNDNGKTEKVIKSYGRKIKYFRKKNGGVSSALNFGIKKMRGEYFSWLSHDDVYKNNKIQVQIEYLRQFNFNKDIILFSDFEIIDECSNVTGRQKINNFDRNKIIYYLICKNAMHGCSLLISKKIFQETGLFNENLRTTQDYEKWFIFSKKYVFHHISLPLIQFRVHRSQGSNISENVIKEGNDIYLHFFNNITSADIKKNMNGKNNTGLFYSECAYYLLRKASYLRIASDFAFKISLKNIFKNSLSAFFKQIKFIIKYFILCNKILNDLMILSKKIIKGLIKAILKILLKYFSFFFVKIILRQIIYPLSFHSIKKQTNIKSKFNSVLHISTLDNAGGAAKLAYAIHKSLAGNKKKSMMLVNDKHSNDALVGNIHNDKSRMRKKIINFVGYFSGYLDCFQLSTFRIKDKEEFKRSDIIHLHNLHGDYFNLFALPEITNIKPCIWTLHDMFAITGHCAHSFSCEKWVTGCKKCPDLNIPPKIYKDRTKDLWNFKKNIYEKSKLTIVCPSNWLKEKVDKSLLKKHDIRMIYNGINEKIFKPIPKKIVRRELNIPQDKIVLLFCSYGGKNNYWKGGEYLDRVYDYFKNDKRIIFINIGGSQTNNDGKIINTGYIDDDKILNLYYSASDLFIYPSLAETFGLVVAESLSSGTPVITFNTGGIPEIVTHMKNGYVAEYKNVNDFIKGINIFLNDKALRKKASLDGRKKVLKSFTEKKMINDYLKLYEEICNK